MNQSEALLSASESLSSISLAGHLTVEEFGKCIDQWVASPDAGATGVLLDFSVAESAELDALFAVLGFASAQRKKGKDVRLRLPDDDGLRSFLSMWNFDDALRKALQASPDEELLVSDSPRFLSNADRRSGSALRSARYGRARSSLVSKQIEIRPLVEAGFLSIQGYPLPLNMEEKTRRQYAIRLALEESRLWRGEAIRCLLEPRLNGPFDHVANRIVFEALANAIWHPLADTVQYGSVFLPEWEGDDSKGCFILVFYDDGTSVIETLRKEIKQHPLVPNTDIPFGTDYRVHFSDGTEGAWDITSPGKLSFAKDSSPEAILAASILPGITSKFGVEAAPHTRDDFQEVTRVEDEPGFGLAILVNAAVQVLRGTVVLWTECWRMEVSQDPLGDAAANSVDVKIERVAGNAFPGNIMRVSLPLRM